MVGRSRAVVDRRCTVEPASPPWTKRRLSGIQKNLHVEVDDVMTWYKINVGIGRAFLKNSLCKLAIVTF